MDFQIRKSDFSAALRQILQGRKADSADQVDMTADRETLTVVVTGRSIEVPIETQEPGSFGIPIGVLFKMKRISGTYQDETLRIRINEGRFRLQGMSVSNPEIKPRKIARRVIDIPNDALPRDIVALPLILSVDEIEDCGLHGKLLEAQKRMADALTSDYETLRPYGFKRDELSSAAQLKVKTHAEKMRPFLFENALENAAAAAQTRKAAPQDRSAMQWLELGFEQWRQRKWIDVYWSLKAAIGLEPNNPTIMMWLGRLCEVSFGSSDESYPFAYKDGAEWYAKAAMLGHAEAQYQHGQEILRYRYESKEEPNPEQISSGIEWLRKAAIQGHGKAAMDLAERFTRGHGVEANLNEALFWFEQGEAAGLCYVEKVLERMRCERRMLQCQIAVEAGDKAASLYVEWADSSQFEFYIGWSLEMFTEGRISEYRKQFPDRTLGESPWWETQAELASRYGTESPE